ncbi:helix-turn-helix domain-containing protein [Egibacter rhizosphaerae]|uniref:helix-turn-helix domain-containing protein n=1 Tax=Egibacter rhizosphaerae TaxID=1670831 RepID=UPI001F10BE32|nr:helix-turn-helix domain-containing protein [Egibacter rhizosphaerae]
MIGQRIRHLRVEQGLTLARLGELVGRQAPYLSQIENGKRETTLSLLGGIASALGTDVAGLLDPTPPSRRAELEIALRRAQADPLFRELGLPDLQPSARLPDEALEHIVRLFAELKRQRGVRAQTPEEARKTNAALREEMRDRGNYFPAIEGLARDALDAVGHRDGPLPQRKLADLARHFGFTVRPVQELPASVRSLVDQRNGRIYIPQRDELDSRSARTVVLQTLGHLALGHADPGRFGEFLRQRVEANYFAGAVLMPEDAAVARLQAAKEARDLSVAELEELFGVSYEMAAHRFTNLATRHLDIPVHFVRSDADGVIWKAYENNGVPFPADPDGAIEGQRLCAQWATRQVFSSEEKFDLHYQYTDTPSGTYWCVTYLEGDREPSHAITVGARFAEAKYFRGRDTRRRSRSRCPEGPCCREPDPQLVQKWDGKVWPSPRPHSHVLAALPAGTFPGVDLAEAYAFLERAEAAE